MSRYVLVPTIAGVLFLAFSCGKHTLPKPGNLTEKCEPYDLFAFQRSYPYPEFDWQGWRKTLQQVRTSESALEKGGGQGCGSNLTNWTQQGPMNVAGRCNTLAIKPNDENTVLAGFSGGGIFKSTDGAVNWKPVFDDNMDLSIGDITFDPTNPNVVYAGTGDPNVPSIVFNGDGIFKSTDAGETWHKLPNSPSGIISKVVVHPTSPSVLMAAVMGNPYKRDNHRGIYKSNDGGNTWQQVLFVSNQAGASDLVRSPANPQILYASFWDRIRNNYESVVYGPNARVYKSEDGGDTWALMGGGLPSGVMGRTGLALSATNPDKAYVVYIDSLSRTGGLYKTVNGGITWSAVNVTQLQDACADFGWYFGKIHLNPTDDEEVFFHAILLWRKPSNGSGWLNAAGGHADSHDLVFAPSGRRYWANDGGVYRNDPGQFQWVKSKNLPTTQFYRTNFNPHEPNTYWAGAQDNGIQKGNGQNPNNWVAVFGADGFRCAFDPSNPLHFWIEIQNGAIHETTDGGNNWILGSTALNTNDRTNWDTPFFLSAHNPNRLYGATFRAYAKDVGGGWGAISGDLTDGNILGARFHTVSCLNESPLVANKLVAGTSDGNVWRREASGTWSNITAGLPDRYVTSVHYSPTSANRIFVTHSGFRDDENTPHVHRSDDNGATWQNITANLPPIPVNDIFIMPGQQDQVLFVATDAGTYFSINAGSSWARLGGNMPYIPVFELKHNPVRKELVAATFARGIWTFPLDSIFVQQPPVQVNLSGTLSNTLGEGVVGVSVGGMLTDGDGKFTIPNLPGCETYTIAPYRNDNPLNGLTTYDLVLISKHILGTEPFDSPFKIIAADANRSGSVTTFDIVQLRRLILGIDSAFANNTSWRFVPTDFVFPNLNNPFQTSFPETLSVAVQTQPIANLNFTAIKTGDVNETAIPNASGHADDRYVGEWAVRATYSVLPDGRIKAEIAPAEGGPCLVAAQFSLRFDPEQFQLDEVVPLANDVSADHFGLKRQNEGFLSFAFANNGQGCFGAEPLFSLIFKKKNAAAPTLALQLAETPTRSIVYLPDGRSLWPSFRQKNEESDGAVHWSPNPFGDAGTSVRANEPGILEIFDGEGKRVFSSALEGGQPMSLDPKVFPQKGVYFWRMGEKSGKLIRAQ
jgi:photosystem II stability/assembly factor-like uncharacterized protein